MYDNLSFVKRFEVKVNVRELKSRIDGKYYTSADLPYFSFRGTVPLPSVLEPVANLCSG